MEVFFFSGMTIFISLSLVSFLIYYYKSARGLQTSAPLPPGRFSWPLLGESLEFLSAGLKGHPEKFVFDRLAKYAPSQMFKTSIIGEKTVFMCGAAANKFLYSSENKNIQFWWPKSFYKILPTATNTSFTEASRKFRMLVSRFLKPDALHRYTPIVDTIVHRHFVDEWDGRDKVEVFPLVKCCIFSIHCRIFMSIEDKTQVNHLEKEFKNITSGIISIPINLPGMPFNKAIKSSIVVKIALNKVIKQRKLDLANGKALPNQDLLSHMLLTTDENGRFMTELEIADRLLVFLLAGDTSNSACTFVVKYLAELPHIYQGVYKEQMEIVESKGAGELLNWKDIQKMKYSWNVACEVLRLTPPIQGAFREAIVEFTYSGFRFPKGWKLYWSAHTTHMDPQYFPNPKNFDPSRFDGTGPKPYTYVPFGGGSRICPGVEFARLQIVVFMHHFVRRFKCEKIIPDEKTVINPMPVPEKGLPVRLYPHSQTLVA